jgi:hypothetical protein
VVNINDNIFRNNTVTGAGIFNAITNFAAVISALNINNNQVGGPAGGVLQYSVGGTGTFTGISNQSAAATATASITGNNFEGITYAGLASGGVILISNSASPLSLNISSNTFTNLNLNTSSNCTFISNNSTLPAGGSLTVNNNSIVTAFTKANGGSVTCYTSTSGTSPAGSTKTAQNNNFSNVTLAGTTTVVGWRDTEGATAEGPSKTISNNIFSNWSNIGSGTFIQMGNSGSNSTISGNTISNITSGGLTYGISFTFNNRGSNQSITNNTISNLTSTGGGELRGMDVSSQNAPVLNITGNITRSFSCAGNGAAYGILINNGATINIGANKIYDLASVNGAVFGILASGTGTYNMFNNLVGDLRVTSSVTVNAIIGIAANGGNADVYSNTVLLNGTTTSGFGTSGISANTSVNLTLRNNLVVNLYTGTGTGRHVAYRRSSTTLSTYSAASNNNSFYAGTPSATHLIFYDGTNSDQTIGAYQSRVATRDAASISENPAFASVVGSSPLFLHIPAATATLLESGGVAIPGFTTDYDNDVRPGPVGSVNGGGIAPDIGADEFDGILTCSGMPTAGTASTSPVSSCGPTTFTLSLSGQSNADSYQWQSSTTAGGPYSNIAGGTTVPFTTGTISTTTYFVCILTCSNSGLSATSNEITGTVYTPVSGTTVVTNVACFGGSNGAINLTPNGGTGPYTFNWLPSGPTTEDRTGLVAGTYSVVITDNAGCTGTVTATVTQPTSPVSGTTVVTNVSCFGGSNGAINLSPTGGSSGYTFNWLPSGPTTEDRTGLVAGTYTVQITDINGCTSTVTASVTQPTSPVSGTTVVTNVSCFGGSNGAINLTPNGGTGSYTFNWLPSGPTTEDRTGLVAGTYTVQITDVNGCTSTVTATVTQPTSPVSGTTVVTNVSCFGGSNGAINLTPNGGTGSYTFNWLPSGPTTEDRTGLVAGTYTVQITDINGCTSTVTASVTQPTSPVSGTTVVTNVSCFGGSNGAINLTPSGGTGTYTFNWLPSGPTTEDRTGLVAGTYTVQITDVNGCTGTVTASVTQPTSPVSGTTVVTNVSCFGGSNGAINLTPSGGSGSYTFNWLPSGPTTEDRTGLVAGTYTVIITDINGCTSTVTASVTQPTSPVSGTTVVTNISCFGGSNGTIDLTPSGGIPGYTYNWLPSGPTTQDRTGLTAGTYTVIITDVNGCSGTVTVTVPQPTSPVSGTTVVTNVSCFGGSNGTIDLTPAGGTPGYTYNWLPSGPTTQDRTGLTAGAYTVIITDVNGCSGSVTVTVTQPTAITTTGTQTDVSCANGSNGAATVTASGGTGSFTYSWTPSGATTASAVGIYAGLHTVTITDANGCTATHTFNIQEPNPVYTLPAQTDVSCFGGNDGTATVTAGGGSGGYTYSWAPSGGNAATATGLIAGTYTATTTDINGCTASEIITVAEPTVITFTSTQTDILCNGGNNGSAMVVATGGTGSFSYLWNFGGTSDLESGLTAGNYSVVITDANSCSTTATFSITEPTAITFTSSQTDVLCNGGNDGSATVVATGGTGSYSYAWPSGGNNATETGLPAGNYSVIITDFNSCSTTATFTITEPTVLAASVINTSNTTTCSGTDGAIDIDVTGGTASYTFLWSNGDVNEDLVAVAAGTYSATITDVNGCTTTIAATINDPNPPVVTVSLPMDTVCGSFPGTISLSGEFPMGGNWSGNTVSGNSFDPFNAGAGTHYITYTYTDINACTGIATDSLYVDLCLSAEETVTATWSLYPNPTSGTITITTNATLSSDVIVEVYSTEGKLLFIENNQQTPIITLDLASEPVGTYFIRLTMNGETTMHRVVKL